LTTGAPEFAAIVLAAGAGRRFGGGQLLAPWAGGALLDGALAAAFAAPAGPVIVVTGADRERVDSAARDFAERTGESGRLRLVHAEDYDEGMGASLRRAAPSCLRIAQASSFSWATCRARLTRCLSPWPRR
jgi:molybdenum cofactor cytidylyltransferase